MKVALIVECAAGGPDGIIYKDVIERLCPVARVLEPDPMINKARLMQEGPLKVKTFLDDGCDYVFIVWDKEKNPGNCETDNKQMLAALEAINVPLNKVRLNCIIETLESWLIADSRAMNGFVASITEHDVTKFADHKTIAEQTAAAQRIKNYFRENYGKWKFNKFTDAVKIYRQLPELDRARAWNNSFDNYCSQIETVCQS